MASRKKATRRAVKSSTAIVKTGKRMVVRAEKDMLSGAKRTLKRAKQAAAVGAAAARKVGGKVSRTAKDHPVATAAAAAGVAAVMGAIAMRKKRK